MDLSLIYRALADRQVDLVAGDATSGLIDAYGLVMLEDNRRYFPPYDAVAVARSATLLAHPDMHAALAALGGQVTVADMRGMNRAVDSDRRDPAEVVREFLARRLTADRTATCEPRTEHKATDEHGATQNCVVSLHRATGETRTAPVLSVLSVA